MHRWHNVTWRSAADTPHTSHCCFLLLTGACGTCRAHSISRMMPAAERLSRMSCHVCEQSAIIAPFVNGQRSRPDTLEPDGSNLALPKLRCTAALACADAAELLHLCSKRACVQARCHGQHAVEHAVRLGLRTARQLLTDAAVKVFKREAPLAVIHNVL